MIHIEPLFLTHSLHFLLVACLAHFSYWLHADYIGNIKSSILSLISFEIFLCQLKNGLHRCLCNYKQLCPICVTWHLLPLMLSTCRKFGSLGTYNNYVSLSFYSDSTPILFLALDHHSTPEVTRNFQYSSLLDINYESAPIYYLAHMVHSTPKVTQHLLEFQLDTYYGLACIMYLTSI